MKQMTEDEKEAALIRQIKQDTLSLLGAHARAECSSTSWLGENITPHEVHTSLMMNATTITPTLDAMLSKVKDFSYGVSITPQRPEGMSFSIEPDGYQGEPPFAYSIVPPNKHNTFMPMESLQKVLWPLKYQSNLSQLKEGFPSGSFYHIYASPLLATYKPNKIHKFKKWMTGLAYHNRIQKKWNKRFGRIEDEHAYMMPNKNGIYLSPACYAKMRLASLEQFQKDFHHASQTQD